MLNLQIKIMPLPEAHDRDSGVRTKGSYGSTRAELTERDTVYSPELAPAFT